MHFPKVIEYMYMRVPGSRCLITFLKINELLI
jgi:hypothetical protein